MASDPHIPTPAGQPASKTEQLYAALDGIPADEPSNYLRQSLQLLLPFLEELQHRVESLEVRLAVLEGRAGTTRVRKHRLSDHLAGPVPQGREKDLAAIATVLVTSEAAGHPIEHVFDQHRGPGGRAVGGRCCRRGDDRRCTMQIKEIIPTMSKSSTLMRRYKRRPRR